MIGAEAVSDASLLEIVRCHLNPHAVAGKNAYTVQAHPAGKVAEEPMVFRLLTENPDAEGGIGETLFYSAYELNHCLTQVWRGRDATDGFHDGGAALLPS